MTRLRALADEEKIRQKRDKFGVVSTDSIGVHHKDLRLLAKEIGTDDQLALELFASDVYEARILCSMIFNPKSLTRSRMDTWVRAFENWEICDSFCMGLFSKSQYALEKAHDWSVREEEFVKRAGFVLMACYGFVNKNAENAIFEGFFPAIKRECYDERIYVRKAVNWALRNIGKRNGDLNAHAISIAKEIQEMDQSAARWIGRNALAELQRSDVKMLNYPRNVYGQNS